jgi:hypothetical protein
MANRSLGTLTVDLIAKTAGFEAGMDKAARLADRRSKDISKAIDRGLKGAVGSVAAFTAGLVGGLLSAQAAFDGFMNSVNNADRLDELSARLGISTEQLSEWGYAAKLSGSDLESLTGSIQKFSKTVATAADANSRQAELFASLGISVKDAAGNLRDVEDLLPEVADRFKALDNETTETALAMELFGRSGAELLEFLNRGSDGLSELADEARELGGVIDGETAQAAAAFKDEIDRLRVATNGYFTVVARELLPALTEAIREFRLLTTSTENMNRTGRLLAGTFDALSKLFDFFGSTIRVNNALFNTYNNTLASVYTTLSGMASLDFSRAGAGIRNLFNGLGAGFNQATGNVPVSGGRARNPRGGSNRPETGGNFSGLNESVNRFLQNEDDASKKAARGTRKVRTEVDQLKQSYDNLTASLSEQIALFGQTTEVAKLRYDLENGELAKLNPAQKEYLLGLAEQLDTKRRLAELQEAADEAVKRESEAFEENRKANKELIADMQFELDLLGMTNEQRQEAIALRYLSADATAEEIEAVRELAAAQRQAAKEAEFWDGVQRNLSDSLYDAISGAKSLKDAVKDFFEELSRQILKSITDQWAQQIAGAFSQSGNAQGAQGAQGGGWMAGVANFFGALIGGARANGGPVQAGVPYLVGERGPELFVAPKTGTIIPNDRMGMGLGQTNNFIVQGRIDRRTQEQMAADVGRKASTAIRRSA